MRPQAKNRRGRTTLLIAQRLGTIVNAACILVMSDGGVVESGTREGLWARRGRYFKLFRLQIRAPAPFLGYHSPQFRGLQDTAVLAMLQEEIGFA